MRDFLKYTFASLAGLILFCSLGVGGLIFLLIAAASVDSGPQVRNKSVLTFDLSLNITDSKPATSTSQAISEALSNDNNDSVSLQTVLQAIEEATQDDRITALYLYGNMSAGSSSSGLATLKEVREALEEFRAKGKKIIAYDMEWGEREYYLGSVANTVVLNPIGSMELNGFSSQPTFYTGALQKYGVGVQVTRVGKYKSAVEPFLLTKQSSASREQTAKLLGDLWSEFSTTVSKDRKLKPQQIQAIADNQGVLLAEEALQRRLVDKVAYFDEVVAELKQMTDSDEDERSFRQISLPTYARAVESDTEKSSSNQVAVVYAEGDIVEGIGGPSSVGGDRLARQLRELRLDDDVKAVVLRVNSPGGSVTASEVIQREVVLIKKVKPIVVSMGDVAASGGYWISTYADRIFAEPNTITGSIGVFGLLPNVQKLANAQGITWDVVKTARFADSEGITRPRTPQELAVHQRVVDRIYDRFLTKVAESRKLPKQKVATLAQGRVWSGTSAKQLGLVDAIGGLNAAVEDAAKRAKLGDDWKLEEYPKTRSLEDQILKRLIGDPAAQVAETATEKVDPFTAELLKVQQDWSTLKAFNDSLGVYARLPLNLRID
ncbi:signal peptide peptidase SppA [Trichocoleus sp. FACHB-262]|uniref:signal peptide peptidase SppA n=1 Tax=Trichocoleus sp. FACHB-262 TaxID=2692869 RepID=UPI001688C0DF|nr:signal peptide peptidase SppA [Trichocoleus sp. FACHB-262]MBD2122746.1 signal peptide peptidase SppA [Trichocoleus sp. FACHB-262]